MFFFIHQLVDFFHPQPLARRNPLGPGQCSSAARGPRGSRANCSAAVKGACGEAGLAARRGSVQPHGVAELRWERLEKK